jgi:hypothetical protein
LPLSWSSLPVQYRSSIIVALTGRTKETGSRSHEPRSTVRQFGHQPALENGLVAERGADDAATGVA